MIEKQSINGKEVWLKIDALPMKRENPNIIPTEYFTASYHLEEPQSDQADGELIRDDDGEPRLFESPVAAMTYARRSAEREM